MEGSMRALAGVGLFVLSLCAAAAAGEVAFTAKPAATKEGDKVKISFTVSAPTDVEVAIVSADGKVVRSLAAGVLGAKQPPPAPLKPGLAQELVWDGKGDWNLPVGNGPFKVRVRAGMGVRFGGLVADSPYNFYKTSCRGMAVDPANGDLYFLGLQNDSTVYFLRVYDRNGKYLRELMPYPAATDAKSRQAFGSVTAPGMEVPAPLNRMSTWPTFYPMISRHAMHDDLRGDMHVRLLGLHPTEKDTLVLLDGFFGAVWRIRKSDGGAGDPFEDSLWSAGTKLAGYSANCAPTGAFSPDGKALYLAGYSGFAPKGSKLHPDWPEGRIYRAAGASKTSTFADVALPAEAPGARPGSPSLDSQNLHGLVVDSKGRVLVCDEASARVRVFSPEGKELAAVETPANPCALAVDEKAGALYVVTRRKERVWVYADALVRIDGWDPAGAAAAAKPAPKVVATLKLPAPATGADPHLALDPTGPAPRLWLSGGARPESLLCIEDRGGKLEIVGDLADRGKAAAGFACRMDVDPEAELVYIHNGWAQTRRYNGLSGDYAGKLGKEGLPAPIIGSEMCVRRDGMVYVSGHEGQGGGWEGPYSRFNRDLTPAPLPDGRKEFAFRYGKMGGGYFGNQGTCVKPDGTLYYNGMYCWRSNAIFEVTPDGKPGRCPRMQDLVAAKALKPGYLSAGFTGAYIGWLQDQSGGVEVDQAGHIYAGIRVLPADYVLPGDFAKARGYTQMTGSIVKFGLEGGGMCPQLPPGTKYRPQIAQHNDASPQVGHPELTVPDKFGPGLAMGAGQKMKGVYIEGALKAYPGLAVLSGFERGEGHCACQTPRFEVDDYGRLYIPNALTCSVQVVDNEGNEIVKFGSYGNFDDGLRAVESAGKPGKIPLAYPIAAKASFKHIYVADSANRRAVRVDPTWQAEEACEIR